MGLLEQIQGVLQRVLDDRPRRVEHIQTFQHLVWEAEDLRAEPVDESLLRDLAYDLEFYRPGSGASADPSFFGDARLEEEIKSVLERIHGTRTDDPMRDTGE